jgi:hypothetical protein
MSHLPRMAGPDSTKPRNTGLCACDGGPGGSDLSRRIEGLPPRGSSRHWRRPHVVWLSQCSKIGGYFRASRANPNKSRFLGIRVEVESVLQSRSGSIPVGICTCGHSSSADSGQPAQIPSYPTSERSRATSPGLPMLGLAISHARSSSLACPSHAHREGLVHD